MEQGTEDKKDKNLDDSNTTLEDNSSIDINNENIDKLFSDIKQLESRIETFEIDEPEIHTPEEVEVNVIQPEQGLESEVELPHGSLTGISVLREEVERLEKQKGLGFKSELKSSRLGFLKRKKRLGSTTTLEGRIPKNPTVFNFGFNEEGKLVNLDLRKPKIDSKKEESGGKKRFNLKKILSIVKRKKGSEGDSDGEKEGDSESKIGGIKGIFGKIGNLKKVIPGKKEKSEEEEKEEE